MKISSVYKYVSSNKQRYRTLALVNYLQISVRISIFIAYINKLSPIIQNYFFSQTLNVISFNFLYYPSTTSFLN